MKCLLMKTNLLMMSMTIKKLPKNPNEFTQGMVFMYPFHERAMASFGEDDGFIL